MKKIAAYLSGFLVAFLLGHVLVLSQPPTEKPKVEEDFTYGKGGTKSTEKGIRKEERTDELGKKRTEEIPFTEIIIKDANGIKREVHFVETFENGNVRSVDLFFDCKGVDAFNKEVIKDRLGTEIFFKEYRYVNGVFTSGYLRGIESNGKRFQRRYNKNTGNFENIGMNTETSGEINYEPDKTTCPASMACAQKVEIFGGYSYLVADFEPKNESLHGWELSFSVNPFSEKQKYRPLTNEDSTFSPYATVPSSTSHPLAGLGFTVDISGHYKSGDDFNINKYYFLAGPEFSFIPRDNACPLIVPYVHLLPGIAKFHSEVNVPVFGKIEANENSFALAAGGGIDFNFGKRIGVRLQSDYILTRFNDASQHNIRFSAGFQIKDGPKIKY